MSTRVSSLIRVGFLPQDRGFESELTAGLEIERYLLQGNMIELHQQHTADRDNHADELARQQPSRKVPSRTVQRGRFDGHRGRVLRALCHRRTLIRLIENLQQSRVHCF
jgi:hypothetical protein